MLISISYILLPQLLGHDTDLFIDDNFNIVFRFGKIFEEPTPPPSPSYANG